MEYQMNYETQDELDLRALKEALEVPENQPFDPRAFVVDDDPKANWALKKIAAYETEAKRIEKNYQMELARLNDWRDRELRRLQGPRSLFEGLIQRYVSRLREAAESAGKKAASFRYSLPIATVRIKDQQPEYKRDDEMLVGWLKTSGYARYVKVVTTEKADWAGFKDRLKTGELAIQDGMLVDVTTGETVAGVEVIERPAKLELDFEPGAVG